MGFYHLRKTVQSNGLMVFYQLRRIVVAGSNPGWCKNEKSISPEEAPAFPESSWLGPRLFIAISNRQFIKYLSIRIKLFRQIKYSYVVKN